MEVRPRLADFQERQSQLALQLGPYRPVGLSLMSVVCKLMENLRRDSLVTHMEENQLVCHQQHGLCAGRSTTTQLLSTLDVWTRILDEGDCVDTVFMDFMKSFDKVNNNNKFGIYIAPHQRSCYWCFTLNIWARRTKTVQLA